MFSNFSQPPVCWRCCVRMLDCSYNTVQSMTTFCSQSTCLTCRQKLFTKLYFLQEKPLHGLSIFQVRNLKSTKLTDINPKLSATYTLDATATHYHNWISSSSSSLNGDDDDIWTTRHLLTMHSSLRWASANSTMEKGCKIKSSLWTEHND